MHYLPLPLSLFLTRMSYPYPLPQGLFHVTDWLPTFRSTFGLGALWPCPDPISRVDPNPRPESGPNPPNPKPRPKPKPDRSLSKPQPQTRPNAHTCSSLAHTCSSLTTCDKKASVRVYSKFHCDGRCEASSSLSVKVQLQVRSITLAMKLDVSSQWKTV